MNKSQAARLLSLQEDEVHDVADSPAGVIVKTGDGVDYVIVEEDHPDAEGKQRSHVPGRPQRHIPRHLPHLRPAQAGQGDSNPHLRPPVVTTCPTTERWT